jgi:DNA-binding transcriptional MocR family regulator
MYTFTPPFQNPEGSPIRELFKYLSEPGMISLGGGYPASDLFDTEGLRSAAELAWKQPARCLQYGPTDGLPELRKEVARVMEQRSVRVPVERVMITTGSQQGFDLLLRVLVSPGETVLTEQPAYPATLQALKLQQAHIVTVPVDEHGIDVPRLAVMLEQGEVRNPKLLYTVPTFANPSGATLSYERRVALVELAVRFGFLLVEDDPYGDLRFSGTPLPVLRAVADGIEGGPESIVYLGSLSKIVAPGLRVGWMIAPSELVRRCVVAKQTADLCGAPWTQAIAAAYLAQGSLAEHLPRIASAYREKCDVLCSELEERLAGALRFHRPEGGMFVWARLDGIDSSELLRYAIAQKVLFVPGKAFFFDHVDPSTLRLSFAAPGVAELKEAASRLARAVLSLRGG